MRFLTLCAVLVLITSCVPHEELVNFRGEDLPYGEELPIRNWQEERIQAGDILRISVRGTNEEALKPFNIQELEVGSSGETRQGGESLRGYLVDSSGKIDFPVLGLVEVEGYSLEQARDSLKQKLTGYLTDPSVNIRFLNYRFTVLGEVRNPGVYTTYNNRVTIMEAIGMASDLTEFANRERVTVIRERDGRRSYHLLDLKSEDVFQSPYYYIQQNDIIYVEPLRAKTSRVADPVYRYVTYGTSVISFVALLISIFKK